MKFGPVALGDAEGAVLAHSLVLKRGRLGKGRVLSVQDLTALAEAGLETVVVARLEAGDIGENEAAARLARAIVPEAAGLSPTAPHAGRVNLKAEGPGVLIVDVAAVNAINAVDPGVTLATLPEMTRVSHGLLAGTVKIIPYAVPGVVLEAACAVAVGAMRVLPVGMRSAGVVLTAVPGGKDTVIEKGAGAVEGRLRALGITQLAREVVAHEVDALAEALTRIKGEIVLILTGSATSDIHDTAPEALRAAGGRVERFGMPVDPGNLLFLGALGDGRPVIGLPGCARSPALNGADWVLERVVCGLIPGAADFAAMGVGGLLKEIPIRPLPREEKGR